jgi:hypothetical protein
MSKRKSRRGARTLQSHVNREAMAPSERVARYSPEYRAWLARQMAKQATTPTTESDDNA